MSTLIESPLKSGAKLAKSPLSKLWETRHAAESSSAENLFSTSPVSVAPIAQLASDSPPSPSSSPPHAESTKAKAQMAVVQRTAAILSEALRTELRILDDRSNRFARVHELEAFVDALEREPVRDEAVDVDLLFHVPIDDLRNVRSATSAAESRALPYTARDELKRARGDLLSRAGDADDHAHPPAAMTALERLTHQADVADALEAVVGAAVREL